MSALGRCLYMFISCCCTSDVFWHHGASQLADGGLSGRCTVSQDEGGVCRLGVKRFKPQDAGAYVVVAVNQEATCKHSFSVTVNTGTTRFNENQSNSAKGGIAAIATNSSFVFASIENLYSPKTVVKVTHQINIQLKKKEKH